MNPIMKTHARYKKYITPVLDVADAIGTATGFGGITNKLRAAARATGLGRWISYSHS